VHTIGDERPAGPPVRRGDRDERRESTLRALAAGQDARCAYCGRTLPPIPPQGGRPTPYCPPDPEHYGRWGAKVITCAMLDEHREIWVSVYGPDQPMTVMDTQALDAHLATALTALDPLGAQIRALRTHVTDQTAAALTAQREAEATRDEALRHAHAASTAREEALAAAERAATDADAARQQSEADRAELRAAQDTTARAIQDRTDALAAREEAEHTRQRALEQVTATLDRVAALQTELSSERAAALDRLDHLRRDAEQAQHQLRAALTTEQETRLREQAADFAEHARAIQAAADQRVTDLAGQLAQATQSYAESLAPLHTQLGALRDDLAARSATAAALQQQLTALHAALRHALRDAPDHEQFRQLVTAALPQTPQPPATREETA
jgi:chromosome segregation ATPase